MAADLREQLQSALGTAYALERELGGGGMSRVFVAEERALGRRVVVKVLPPELAAGVSAERFRREIQLSASLQHPHVVPVLTAGAAGELLYYTMPYVEGASLRERLAREGALPVPEAVRILREVADALAHAHAHGVVHRDVKPANVLLTERHAVVTDFGVAKALTAAASAAPLTSTGLVVGTPAYMAPEQATADQHVDHRADIYALGAVAYEVLAGQPPFGGHSAQAVLAAHVTRRPEPLTTLRPAVPPALAGLVMHCLEKHPADRPQSADEVLRALDHIELSHTAPAAGGPRAPAGRRRRVALRAAVAGIAAVALTGVAATVLRGRADEPLAERVLVLPFQNRTGDPKFDQLGEIAGDWVTRGLTESGIAEAVAPPSSGGGGGLRAVANAVDAGTVVSGAYYLRGDSIEFTAEINDVARAAVVTKVGPVRGPATAPTQALGVLGQRVQGGLAVLLDAVLDVGHAVAQPPTYEAYREFLAGERVWYTGDLRRALAHYYRAAELDSTFTTALVSAAHTHHVMGECATTDSLSRELRRVPGRLSRYQELYNDRTLARCRGAWMAAYRAAKAMHQLAPRSEDALYVAARSALPVNRPREALGGLERLHPERGAGRGANYVYFQDLCGALHMLGEHRRELEAARRGRTLYPDVVETAAYEIVALAALGNARDAQGRVEQALAMDDRGGLRRSDLLRWAADELAVHGHPAEARGVAERLVALLHGGPSDSASFGMREFYLVALAEALARTGRLAEGLTIADSLVAASPDDWRYRGLRGRLAARLGRRADAEREAAWLAALTRPYMQGRHTYARAQIAAILGRRDEAIGLLRESIAQGIIYYCVMQFVCMHNDPDLQSLRGHPSFRELLRPKG